MNFYLIGSVVAIAVIAFLDGMLFQAWRERRKWQANLSEEEQTLASIVILED